MTILQDSLKDSIEHFIKAYNKNHNCKISESDLIINTISNGIYCITIGNTSWRLWESDDILENDISELISEKIKSYGIVDLFGWSSDDLTAKKVSQHVSEDIKEEFYNNAWENEINLFHNMTDDEKIDYLEKYRIDYSEDCLDEYDEAVVEAYFAKNKYNPDNIIFKYWVREIDKDFIEMIIEYGINRDPEAWDIDSIIKELKSSIQLRGLIAIFDDLYSSPLKFNGHFCARIN